MAQNLRVQSVAEPFGTLVLCNQLEPWALGQSNSLMLSQVE